MQHGDKVYWYDLTWISGQMGSMLFHGKVLADSAATVQGMICCAPNIGTPRRVPKQLVKPTLSEAKAAAHAWVTGEKKRYNDMFNGILAQLRP